MSNNLRIKINYDEYWDFIINNDFIEKYDFSSTSFNDKCLASYINVELYDCVFEDTINGLNEYTWNKAISNGYTLKNIGYTGFDNGLLYFEKDKIMNSDFLKLYQNSEYVVEDNNILKLHAVTGSTKVYEYPLTIEDFDVKFNGGFFQGFFKTECGKYEVLPSKLESGDVWSYEFVLKRVELEKESNKTLNDKYPNNKGIFFYIGTRAENKWVYLYNDTNDECFTLSYDDYIKDGEIDVKTHKIDAFLDMSLNMYPNWDSVALDDYISYKYNNKMFNHTSFFNLKDKPFNIEDDGSIYVQDCCSYDAPCLTIDNYVLESDIVDDGCLYDYIEDDIDISDFEYKTDNDFFIGKIEYYIDTDNKFLLFDRTCSGFTTSTWKDGTSLRYILEKRRFKDNLFLLMNRTCTGYTVADINKLREETKVEYNECKDIWNNALAFRITDTGAIGYRYLIKGCTNNEQYEMVEAYSKDNVVPYDEWVVVHAKIVAYDNSMVIKFYVNGVLVFVTRELPKLNLRELDEIYEKQETVPFNISIGGGTQGLCDTILPNYMIEPYRVYPLEKNFAGTFIGYFKSFKFYLCDLEYLDILNNFKYEINKLKVN